MPMSNSTREYKHPNGPYVFADNNFSKSILSEEDRAFLFVFLL
jgi:hypothetical protein